MKDKDKTVRNLTAGILAVVTAGTSPLAAQAKSDDDQVIQLSPFEVNAEGDTGYQAQYTLSGTRLNSPIADLAITMTVFTPEVWQDLGMSSTNELINFTPGAEINYSGKFFFADSTKFRGVLVENILRNSWKSNVPNDSYNADRMEFSRGPNAILVNGSSTYGGINRSTSKAIMADQSRLLVRTDSYGSLRGELDLNRVLLEDKLAFRFSALDEDQESWRSPISYKDQTRWYGALKWQPTKKLSIDLTHEDIQWTRSLNDPFRPLDFATPFLNAGSVGRPSSATATPASQPAGVASYSSSPTTMVVDDGNPNTPLIQNWANYAVGAEARVFGSSVSVPAGLLDNEFDIIGDGLSHIMFGDVTNLDISYSPAENLYLSYQYNKEYMKYDFIRDNFSNRLQIDASTTLPDGVTPNPNFGRFFMGGETSSNRQDRYLGNQRVSLAYKLDFASRSDRLGWLGKHDITLAAEEETMSQHWSRPVLVNQTPLPGYSADLSNAVNRVRVVTYLDVENNTLVSSHNPRDFVGQLADGVDSQFLSQIAGDTFSRDLESYLGVVQSRFWNDRVVTTFGFRSDAITEFQADPNWTRFPNGLAPDGHQRGRVPSDNSGQRPETRTRAAVYHAIKSQEGLFNGLSFFYNDSDAVTLLFPELLLDGKVRPTTVGVTEDFGLRFQMFDNRLSGVLTLFDSASQNVRYNDAEWFGRAISIERALGNNANAQPADVQDQTSEGYEFQLTANLTQNWRLAASYSHFETVITNIGSRARPFIDSRKDVWLANGNVLVPDQQDKPISVVYAELLDAQSLALAQEGTRTNQERRDKVTLLSNYAITEGALSGWGFGGNMIWTSAPNVAFGNKMENGLIVVDADNVFFGSDTLTFGAHVSYTKKDVFKNMDWRVQLNINNVGNSDDDELESARVQPGTLQNVAVPLTYRLREPRSFVLTNTLTF